MLLRTVPGHATEVRRLGPRLPREAGSLAEVGNRELGVVKATRPPPFEAALSLSPPPAPLPVLSRSALDGWIVALYLLIPSSKT